MFGLGKGGLTSDAFMKRAYGSSGKAAKFEGVKCIVLKMEDGTERTIIPRTIEDLTAPGLRSFLIVLKEWYENGEYKPTAEQASV